MRTIKKLFPILLVVVVMGVLALPAAAQDYPPNTITVSGVGSASGAPDIARLDVGVDVVDADVATAFNTASDTLSNVINALVEAGIAREDIRTSGINMWVEDRFGMDTGGEQGQRVYHVSQSLNIVVRDISTVGDVITAAVEAGANQIYGLTFSISDTTALEEEARAEAFANAQERAGNLAEVMGVTLGEPVIVIENHGGGFPGPVAFDTAASGLGGGAGVPVEGGQLTVSVQVQVTFAMGE